MKKLTLIFLLFFAIFCKAQTNTSCEKAQLIACSEVVNSNAEFLDTTTKFCDKTEKGQYYKYIGNGSYLRLRGVSFSENTTRVLVSRGECNNTSCLSSQDFYNEGTIIPSLNKDFVFKTDKDSIYYIKIINDYKEALTLSFECVAINENINCSKALNLACGTKASAILLGVGLTPQIDCFNTSLSQASFNWYKIEKIDGLLQLKIDSMTTSQILVTLVKGSCENQKCIQRTYLNKEQSFVFYSKSDDDYYIVINAFDKFRYDKILFSIQCVSPISNDECIKPVALNCGSAIDGNLEYATPSANINCPTTGVKDLWYSIKGEGKTFSIKPTVENKWTGAVYISEYKGKCDSLSCFSVATIYNPQIDQIQFFGEKDKTYYLTYSAGDENNSFHYVVDCISENLEVLQLKQRIKLFPNPAKESATLFFESKLASKVQIELYNQIGQKIYTLNGFVLSGDNSFILSTHNLPDGVYVVKVKTDGVIYSELLVVRE